MTKPRVKLGKVKLLTPHLIGEQGAETSEFSFTDQIVQGTYAQTQEKLAELGLLEPTFSQSLSQVVGAYNAESECKTHFQPIIDSFKEFYVRGFTGVSYDTDGILVEERPDYRQGENFIDRDALMGRLGSTERNGVVYSDDGLVRFLKPEIARFGEQTPLELSVNPLVIALANGVRGAYKIAELAEMLKGKKGKNPKVWPEQKLDSRVDRVASLYYNWNGMDRLNVNANGNGNEDDGCSFGVYDGTAEGSLEKSE